MNKHKLTAALYATPRSLFCPIPIDKVKEEFFSSYNAHRRMSELEYLGYEDIKLVEPKPTYTPIASLLSFS